LETDMYIHVDWPNPYDFDCPWCSQRYREDFGLGDTPSYETKLNCHGCGKEITVTRRETVEYEVD
jgi:sarcosine oxidase delta subunit